MIVVGKEVRNIVNNRRNLVEQHGFDIEKNVFAEHSKKMKFCYLIIHGHFPGPLKDNMAMANLFAICHDNT